MILDGSFNAPSIVNLLLIPLEYDCVLTGIEFHRLTSQYFANSVYWNTV